MKNERFVLNDKSTFDYIYDNRNQSNIGEIINTALADIEEENKTKLKQIQYCYHISLIILLYALYKYH